MAEHRAPLHADMPDGPGRRRGAIDIGHVRIATLCMKPGREDTAIVLDLFGRQHYGAGAVAEQHAGRPILPVEDRSEEHTSELQSLMRISYAVFCLKKKNRFKTSCSRRQL